MELTRFALDCIAPAYFWLTFELLYHFQLQHQKVNITRVYETLGWRTPPPPPIYFCNYFLSARRFAFMSPPLGWASGYMILYMRFCI